MLQCITSSPKINEIIACQKYCYRDLSKWPKLDRLSQGQINFFDSLIFQKHLEADAVSEAVYTLGVIHYRFARYGMKPHFLDLWQQQFSDILLKLRFDDDDEKRIFIEAFSIMNKYVVDVMNIAYAKCQQSAAKQEKLS
ncbi:unnamed protein product [Auanema sp. JU1783]|nr:unnamed protein product [Auanema sp. JU1783]